MKSKKCLLCFTSSYPFGMKETYVENELKYLAKGFDKIYIQPKYNPFDSNRKRDVPSNVVVLDPVVPANKAFRVFQGLISFAPSLQYFNDFLEKKVYLSFRNFFSWFNSFIVFRILYKQTKAILNDVNGDENLLVYSYWGEAPLLMTKLLEPFTKVIRMHRGDFYLDVNNGYLPVREHIYKSANLLIPISRDISNRLQLDYKINKDKIFVNYLGVDNQFGISTLHNEDDNVIRIVSCSRVDPIKRVHMIVELIKGWNENRTLEWHHFGDGKNYEEVQISLQGVDSNSRSYLHGWASQEEIFNFYKSKYVTWFLNLSLHEGVPVSIMEAISFGIPAIATDVGATSEIVNGENGYLVSKDLTVEELHQLIKTDQSNDYVEKRTNAYKVWQERFNAPNNYSQLIRRMNLLIGNGL